MYLLPANTAITFAHLVCFAGDPKCGVIGVIGGSDLDSSDMCDDALASTEIDSDFGHGNQGKQENQENQENQKRTRAGRRQPRQAPLCVCLPDGWPDGWPD